MPDSAVKSDPVLVLTRQLKATPERVFAAWVERDRLMKWFGPEGMHIPQCSMDAKVGGDYRITMRGEDDGEHTVFGRYTAIEPHHRLAFTWQWVNGSGREMTVEIALKPKDGGTELVLTQTDFIDAEARDKHSFGWSSSFNSLEAYLAEAVAA